MKKVAVKKMILFMICTILLATAVSAAHLSTKQLECRTTSGACDQTGEVDILHMSHLSSKGNAHAEQPSATPAKYTNKICCKLDGTTSLGNECTNPDSASDIVVQLRTPTNAHISSKFFDSLTYNNPVCISAPGDVHCITSSTAPDPRYECVVAISGHQNGHVASCSTTNLPSSYEKVWCRADNHIARLPKFWHEAYGDLYQDYERGHTRLEDTFPTGTHARNNVVVIDDTDNKIYGVVSDRHFVDSASTSFVTASASVHCTSGAGAIELEFWNEAGDKITPFTSKDTTKTNQWERIGVSATVPTTATQMSVLLRSKKEPLLGTARGTCGFDDIHLELSKTQKLVAPLFTPYEDYEEELLVNPNLKYITPTQGGYACCPENTCWDGATCHANQAASPESPPINDHRCIDGDWVFTPGRIGINGDEGYCPRIDQCLVTPNGDPDKNDDPSAYYASKDGADHPQCITDGQFIVDDYCSAGEWTTRTRLLAKNLTKLIDDRGDRNEYTLYCDQFDLALVEFENDFDSILGLSAGTDAIDSSARSCFRDVNEPCTNNFCVLEFKEGSTKKRVVGVSLNGDIDGGESIFPAFGYDRTACNGKGANGFEQCTGGDDPGETLWYDDITDTLIYSKDGINMDPLTGAAALFNTISNVLNNILGFFFDTPPLPEDVTFIESTTQFDRLYVHANGDQRINAIQETVTFRFDDDPDDDNPAVIESRSFLLVKYHKFDDDLCNLIGRADSSALSAGGYDPDIIRCDKSGDVITMYTEDLGKDGKFTDGPVNPRDDDYGALEKWQDFTSKLRVD